MGVMTINGLILVVLGMGIVFLFLIVMLIVLSITSKIIDKFHVRFVPSPIKVAGSTKKPEVKKNNDEILAVISAAVAKYRK